MSADNFHLLPGEKIFYESRVRWYSFTGHLLLTILILAIFSLAVALAVSAHMSIFVLIIYLLMGLFFIIRIVDFIRMMAARITLTNRRILFHHFPGLGHHEEIPLQEIDEISTGTRGVVLKYKSNQSRVFSIPHRREFVEAYQRIKAQVAAANAPGSTAAASAPASLVPAPMPAGPANPASSPMPAALTTPTPAPTPSVPDQAIPPAENNKNLSPSEAVHRLISYCDQIDQGYKKLGSDEGREIQRVLEPKIREIGQDLFDRGGEDLMLRVAKDVAATSRHGRYLEGAWDRIGTWLG